MARVGAVTDFANIRTLLFFLAMAAQYYLVTEPVMSFEFCVVEISYHLKGIEKARSHHHYVVLYSACGT